MSSFAIRIVICSTIFSIFNSSLHAQDSATISQRKQGGTNKAILSGKITEAEKGSFLTGASIYIPDLKFGVISDTKGAYIFRSVPTGSYLVQVGYMGFKTITRTISINGATTADFNLSPNIVEESEVVVTGISKATQIKRSPIPIVTINHDNLASNIQTNIIDAITKVPGITAVTTGPNVSKPYIRGLGFNRILTLFDGVRQEGQQWGDEHGIEVDQYSIDRVEVVKGPASLSYGSDALAGVVNLIPTQPAPEGRIIGDILGEYQTNNRLIAGSAMLGGTKHAFEWMARLSHKQATNYQNKVDGRVYGSSFKETDATAYLGVHGNWGFSHLSLSTFNDQQEIPDGSRDSATGKFTKQTTEADLFRPIVSDGELKSYKIGDIHQHIRHFRVYSNNSFTVGQGQLKLNLAYQRSHRQEFSHPEDVGTPGLDLNLNTYNYDLKYYLNELNGWNLVLGVNGMYQKNNVTKGTEFVIPSYRQFDVGPFLLLKKTFNKVDISGGLRYDNRSFKHDELFTKVNPATGFDLPVYGADIAGADTQFLKYSHDYSGSSGSIGFTYNASEKLSFKLNLARGFRAPNISEISANGVHPGTNIYQLGNASFKPEFSFQQDIGFVYASKFVVVNMSLFNNSITNYIFNQKLLSNAGGDSVIIDGNETFKFQQGKARLYGGEMNIDFHPFKPLHFENSFSLVYGQNKEANGVKIDNESKYLPFIPPFHSLTELRYDFEDKPHHMVKGFIKAQMVYYSSQERVYLADNTETPTAGYTLFNMGVGSGFTGKTGKTICNIYIMANNLFDVAYFDHLSRLKYFLYSSTDNNPSHGIRNMGRNIALKLDFPLDFSF